MYSVGRAGVSCILNRPIFLIIEAGAGYDTVFFLCDFIFIYLRFHVFTSFLLYYVINRFDQIINKEIPSTVVYEDDKVFSDSR